MAPKAVVFLSYDGMTDPLGQSQVLPYLFCLQQKGFQLHLISFEKPRALSRPETIAALCQKNGLRWYPQRYHKNPPLLSTLLDLLRMYRCLKRVQAQSGASLVHARGYIAALAALRLKQRQGIPFLFDMRGFWADEKRDAGAWPQTHWVYNAVYRFFKRRESNFMLQSAAAISLTRAGKNWLLQQFPQLPESHISVIPCSTDVNLFNAKAIQPQQQAALRQALELPETAKLMVYLGSVGTWYLIPELLQLMALYLQQEPEAYALFICPGEHAHIQSLAQAQGIAHRVRIRAVERPQIPLYLSICRVAAFFIRPSFSKISSSPTKLGEFMAMGLPCISNTGIGDVTELVQKHGCGALVTDFNEASYRQALAALPACAPAEHIRNAALQEFDLQVAAEKYAALYRAHV